MLVPAQSRAMPNVFNVGMFSNAQFGREWVYLHLSTKHLQAIPNPLDQLQISNLDNVKRSRRLKKK